jgi:hypothetical protein
VSGSDILVDLGDVVIDLFDGFSLFDKFHFSVVLDSYDVFHHSRHSIEIFCVLVNYLGLELGIGLNGCSFYISLLLELLLLNLGFVVYLIVIVVRLLRCCVGGSSALSELHVLLHLLLDALFQVPEPNAHVVVASFECLFFIFQFFLNKITRTYLTVISFTYLVFVLYLDGVEIVEFRTEALQGVF